MHDKPLHLVSQFECMLHGMGMWTDLFHVHPSIFRHFFFSFFSFLKIEQVETSCGHVRDNLCSPWKYPIITSRQQLLTSWRGKVAPETPAGISGPWAGGGGPEGTISGRIKEHWRALRLKLPTKFSVNKIKWRLVNIVLVSSLIFPAFFPCEKERSRCVRMPMGRLQDWSGASVGIDRLRGVAEKTLRKFFGPLRLVLLMA